VVDDSAFFRKRLTEILSSDSHIEVVGSASNGKEAIDQVAKLKPDVVTMDIEMPIMDGISAVRRIMETTPTPILMFSSLTTEGAKATFDALDAGAVDFLPKQMEEISSDRETVKRQLCARVRLIGARGLTKSAAVKAPKKAATVLPVVTPAAKLSARRGKYRLVAIGTSTGGPVALQEVLIQLPKNFPLPIVLIQHMPSTFTPAFAERLNKLCQIAVKEAHDGDILMPGTAFLAPGGKQMLIEAQRSGAPHIRIIEADAGQTYKPSVDVTFASVASVYEGDVLAVVLTGMGADGREGARVLKQKGATVWAQDEASCVIYGMPAAIVDAGLADRVVSLKDVGPGLVESV
jgi:two-component system chemotaxis response regulator CheB